jgi:hypothetical protein
MWSREKRTIPFRSRVYLRLEISRIIVIRQSNRWAISSHRLKDDLLDKVVFLSIASIAI